MHIGFIFDEEYRLYIIVDIFTLLKHLKLFRCYIKGNVCGPLHAVPLCSDDIDSSKIWKFLVQNV